MKIEYWLESIGEKLNSGRYKCNFCKKITPTLTGLKIHWAKCHEGVEPMIIVHQTRGYRDKYDRWHCVKCRKTMKTQSGLLAHFTRKHGGLKNG